MEQLRKKSIKPAVVLLLFLGLLGAVIVNMGIRFLMDNLREPTPLEEVDFSGDIDNLYVTGTIYFIYDPYAQETSGQTIETVEAYEYVIDADDTYYMGLRVASDDMEASEALLQASYNYMNGLDDGTELVKYQIEVTGLIRSMPDESLDLYHEYLDYDNLEAAQKELFLPYYLEVGTKSTADIGSAICFIITGAFLIIIGVQPLISTISGKNQKELHNYINASSSPEAAKARIEQFLASAPSLHGLQYDNNFICAQNGPNIVFGETEKLVWAYTYNEVRKKYFITVSTVSSVHMVFTNGTLKSYTVKDESQANDILALLNQLCPRAIIGYNDDLKKLYKKDFNEFMKLKYHVVNVTE